jgi:hypothetical protein
MDFFYITTTYEMLTYLAVNSSEKVVIMILVVGAVVIVFIVSGVKVRVIIIIIIIISSSSIIPNSYDSVVRFSKHLNFLIFNLFICILISVFPYFTAGVPTFRVLSPLMGYSVFLYIWILVVGYFNTGDLLFLLLENNDDFLTYTFNALLLMAVVFSCCVPVLYWLDCPKYVHYLNTWAEFQVKCTSISLTIRPTIITYI